MSPNEAIPPALLQQWFHSYEEDAAGQQVFRPSSWDLPPARGRYGFELKPNGEYNDLDIAPTDGTLLRPGSFALAADGTLTLSPAGAPPRRFKVVSIAPDRLVLTPAPTASANS
jgi:hypothetical protein